MEGGFLSPKGSRERRCAKEKSGGSVDTPNGNKRNLTNCSTLDSSTAFHILFGGNTRSISYAKLLNEEPSRKTVILRPLLASVGNGANVAIFVESVHEFHTMTPQDPSWNMDTGASSHLADNIGLPDPKDSSPL
uniref:Uncharacterized protein n=1 Tax=Tanacetum cinerariifolium TaxID=118510 RepID=A0A6L2N7I3_TANCI|nr:hypothetical protein [Tanacetum cinerariifolium]